MTDTPRTREEWRRIQRRPDGRYDSEITYEDLAHGMSNFAKQLERELAEARGQISDMEIRHAATMLHTQSVVDDAIKLREQRDRLAAALERILEYQGRFAEEDPESIAAEALAAVEGGEP